MKTDLPKEFEQTFKLGNFPDEMRRQLWPLCCGASIISGFKNVKMLTQEELTSQISQICDQNQGPIPDFQVYAGERINPSLTFLTLNYDQLHSKKIMEAIKDAGFFKIGECAPRGMTQGFFVRDESKTWMSFDENPEEFSVVAA
jgi:hypothetical protein